jgi:peptidoglycan/xylan/chitin deacetylase (PgdA/CDA1 family)
MGLHIGQLARELGRWIPAAALRHTGQPAALFFHGVEGGTTDGRVQTNHHEAAQFRAMLLALKHNFDVLPLNAIDEVLAHPHKHSRSVFLMSDDGYRNTLSVAADILAEFAMPWTLFVSTAHIGTGKLNPIFLARLFFLFAPAGTYDLPHISGGLRLSDPESREKSALSAIEALRFLPANKAEETLGAMCAVFPPGELKKRIDEFESEKFLDWDEVRALSARGVIIGAHADTHWPMHAHQNENYLRQQAFGARARIETEVGPCRFFAYPFGNKNDIGSAAWRAVRDAGFTHGFTTLSGSLAAGGNPYLLPRYGIGPKDSHIASLVPLLFAANPRLLAWQHSLG